MVVKRSPHGLTIDELRQLVPEPDVIVEIGCNDGTDTAAFVSAFPGLEIHCFEPDPRPIKRFWPRMFPLLSSCGAKLYLYQVAVSDINDKCEFFQSDGTAPTPGWEHLKSWDLSGSLLKPTGHLQMSPWVKFENKIEVHSVTLNDWAKLFPNVRKIDLMWVDVQGAEHLVVEGADVPLSYTKYFYCEYYDTEMYKSQKNLAGLVQLLKPLGFELVSTHHDNALFKNQRFTS